MITKFSKDSFNRVIDILIKYDFKNFKDQEILLKVQSEIEEKLYYFRVYKHESILIYYNKAEEKLIKIYNSILPKDDVVFGISLFNNERKIIISKLDEYTRETSSWKKIEEIVNKERSIKILEIYKKYWFAWISELVKKSIYFHLINKSIIDSWLKDKIKEGIFKLLDNDNNNLVYFARGFIRWLDFLEDNFIKNTINNFDNIENNILKSNFLIWLILNTRTLKLVKKQNKVIQELFWKWLWKLNLYRFLGWDNYEEIDYFIWELNKHWFAYISFNEISGVLHSKKMDLLSNKLIIETLEELVYFINNKIWNISSLKYNLNNILEYLYKEFDEWNISKEDLFKIEIIYTKAINNPKILSEDLSSNPESYVQIICNIYKSKNQEKEKLTVDNSYEILKKFKLIPWYKNWKINSIVLEKWITKVLKLLKEKDRYNIWCKKVWELLINWPIWKDLIRPCEEIRKIFEKFENEALENGFIVWKLNSRWVTSRWMYDWGEQERKLAKWFYDDAEKIKKNYPRTAKILKQLWDSYNWDARREDERVKLDG